MVAAVSVGLFLKAYIYIYIKASYEWPAQALTGPPNVMLHHCCMAGKDTLTSVV